nr:cache domain-containing protein [uncultured Desulfobacter sp.]
MPLIKEDNIGIISFISSTILVVLLTSILGGIFIRDQHRHFQQDLQKVGINFFKMQKERLRSEVDMQIRSINAWHESARQRLKTTIKARTYEAYAVAENLFEQNKEKRPEEIQAIIREAIRPIRFNDGRGYFFIRDTRGPFVLYPPNPKIEGPHVKLFPHQNRKELFQRINTLLFTKGEGFIDYQWPKPGGREHELFEKMTFVKYFKPFGWSLGTGEYLVNFESLVQKSIIDTLNSIIPSDIAPEYIFIYQLHNMNGGNEFATMLVNPNRPDLIGKKISDNYTDIKGKMFRKEMVQGIRDTGEAFVSYWYKNPGSEEPGSKLSYFKYYPAWKWIVAKGISLDDMNKRITSLQKNLNQETKRTIRNFIYFILISTVCFLVLGYIFSKGIHRIFLGYKAIQEAQQHELEQVNAQLKIQSITDTLTSLFNKGYFNDHLEIEIARSLRHGSALSLVVFDIDKFKQINDRFGHLAGDDVLKKLALLCQNNIRASDIFARWGGEEFVVLSPESDKNRTIVFAEKLRRLIEEYSFSIPLQVTCSFGVTEYREGESVDSFIHRADQALYTAKEEGRNKVVFR